MDCKNHPRVAATARCAGCGEAFCPNCLVQIGGQAYCATCKTRALPGTATVPEEATVPCKEADDAFIYSLVGIVCLGIFLEPYALYLAIKARRITAANPRFSGAGKATAALVISSIVLGLWALALAAVIVGVVLSAGSSLG